ncbi:cationic amino acid transporter 6, chloroplastic-like [Cicer arietinum]|uniref:cationic amino acid transporter 6, chloroplastic-like n=1 Tax=Cicer arietinum TaxID=3827 RepID=UPI003CC612B8
MTMLSNYLYSLSQTHHELRKRMLATWTPDQEFNQVRQRSGADMKRKLKWYDLIALGVGGMLGVGVFVTTGPVSLHQSGEFMGYFVEANILMEYVFSNAAVARALQNI